MPRKKSRPRSLSIVTFIGRADTLQPNLRRKMSAEKHYVFLGEIPNMPGHCIVLHLTTGRALSPYHTCDFIEVEHADL